MESANTLHIGDALSQLSYIQDKSVDLTILDPNYEDWDRLIEDGLLKEVMRVTKDTGNVLCFTKQPFDLKLRNVVDPYFRHEFIWSFTNGGAWVSNRKPLISFQKIYWLTLSKGFDFNPRTGLPYNSKTKTMKRKTKNFEGYEAEGRTFVKSDEGIFIRDHLHYEKPCTPRGQKYVPAKPLQLIEILVRCFCPRKGIVLDPFFGSGTTGVACLKNNRQYVGIERNAELVSYIQGRLKQL